MLNPNPRAFKIRLLGLFRGVNHKIVQETVVSGNYNYIRNNNNITLHFCSLVWSIKILFEQRVIV